MASEVLLENLTKTYNGDAGVVVDNVNLRLPSGMLTVFVGPSGCGKTTTLRMINRLTVPTSGRVLIDGEDVRNRNPNELRRGIGYVVQQHGLFPHLTVAGNISIVPKLMGWNRSRTRDRVDELLTLVNLDPSLLRDRMPAELSGGQQQRVGVARALAVDPPLLLLDEPFGALDPGTRNHMQEEFLRIQETVAKTVVLVTHDMDEAIRLADQIVVFGARGRIQQVGTPSDIVSTPASGTVSDLVGADAAIRLLRLRRVGDIMTTQDENPSSYKLAGDGPARVHESASAHEALNIMLTTHQQTVIVVDADSRPIGHVSLADIVGSTIHADTRCKKLT